MVRAESVSATLIYTYTSATLSASTADGLRVAQSVDGAVTTFAWDWATGVPELLSAGDALYLVGHETLGQWDDAWTYYLPDALGSVRQATDGVGAVVSSREWTPYGVEIGGAQAGLGYTGEWFDGNAGLLYLRARWYRPQIGIFLSRDLVRQNHPYQYAEANPVNLVDPSGKVPRPPIPRPSDVCPYPGIMTISWRPEYILRHKDGSRAYYPSWDVDAWWYCGEFKVTAYQFVLESAYVNTDGTLMSPVTGRILW